MIQELTCIGCPLGCPITVEINEGTIISITVNTCKRGYDYASKEVTNPTRIVTSTLPVSNRPGKMLSVKTQTDIPKSAICDCMKALKDVAAAAPIRIGDVVVDDVAGTGVAVIATKDID